VIIFVWALLHLGGRGQAERRHENALNFFVDSSTMGTILILVVYFLSNLALAFYYRRYRPQEFNVLRHAVLRSRDDRGRGRVTTGQARARLRPSTGSRTRRSA